MGLYCEACEACVVAAGLAELTNTLKPKYPKPKIGNARQSRRAQGQAFSDFGSRLPRSLQMHQIGVVACCVIVGFALQGQCRIQNIPALYMEGLMAGRALNDSVLRLAATQDTTASSERLASGSGGLRFMVFRYYNRVEGARFRVSCSRFRAYARRLW